MNLISGDIIVFKVSEKLYKSTISKVDGNVIKLFEEDGSYRQMSSSNLENMIKNGFAYIEKVNE